MILTRLFPDAQLLRTRDHAVMTPGTGKIIYDVGGDYNVEARIFDHHQHPNPLRDDDQPYSSFGLIWAHYGQDYLAALDVPAGDIATIHAKFCHNARFIAVADRRDAIMEMAAIAVKEAQAATT